MSSRGAAIARRASVRRRCGASIRHAVRPAFCPPPPQRRRALLDVRPRPVALCGLAGVVLRRPRRAADVELVRAQCLRDVLTDWRRLADPALPGFEPESGFSMPPIKYNVACWQTFHAPDSHIETLFAPQVLTQARLGRRRVCGAGVRSAGARWRAEASGGARKGV